MKRLIALVAASMMLLTMAAQADEIKVGGGGAAISSIHNPVKAAYEKASGDKLTIMQSTPKLGMRDLVEGKLDAATAAVPLDKMLADVQKDGIAVNAADYQAVQIGTNSTVVYVNPANPVSTLSKDQMKGIFTGKITNWKDVGGKDAAIIVVWGLQSPGQNAQFKKVILDDEAVTKDVLEATNYANIKENVVANPDAIGIDPLGLSDATVKVIKPSPAVEAPIFLATKGKPSAKIQKYMDFIKGEGQKYIQK